MKKKLVILYCLSFFIFCAFALFSSFPYLVDETGTLANAATIVGYDWSLAMYSMENYAYNMWQAIFYIPVLLFVKNPFFIYKGIMLIHGLFYSLIPVCAYIISKKYLIIKEKECFWISLIIALIPTPFLLSMYATADLFLIVFPWLISLSLLKCLNEDNNKIRNSVILGFLSMYVCISHGRGFVITLSVILLLLIMRFKYKNKSVNFIAFFIPVVFLFFINEYCYGLINSVLFSIEEIRPGSFELYGLDTYKKIFTIEGFLTLIKMNIGLMYAIICMTFGTIIIFLKRYNVRIKNNTLNNKVVLSRLFLFMLISSFIFSVLWFYPIGLDVFTQNHSLNFDGIIYIRYVAFSITPIIFLAFCSVISKDKKIEKKFLYSSYFSLFILIIIFYYSYNQTLLRDGRWLLNNISSLIPFWFLKDFSFGSCALNFYLVALLCISFYYLIISFSKKKNFYILSILILLLYNSLCFYNSKYKFEKDFYMDIKDAVSYLYKIDGKNILSIF